MKKTLVILFICSMNYTFSQNRITNWDFTLNTQEEIVLTDTDFERSYLIYRDGDGSNSHAYNIFIKVDGQLLKDPNSNNVTLEEESSSLVRGKKIVLVRSPASYNSNHIIQGNFQQIGETDDIFLNDPDFSLIQGNDSPTLIISLVNPRRVRLNLLAVNSVSLKPYVNIYIDGVLYNHNGAPFQLQEGSSIELYGKYISLSYPSGAPSLPAGSEFLKGNFTVFDN